MLLQLRKVQQNHSLLKLHTKKEERALGALNGTLLHIPQCFSHNSFLEITSGSFPFVFKARFTERGSPLSPPRFFLRSYCWTSRRLLTTALLFLWAGWNVSKSKTVSSRGFALACNILRVRDFEKSRISSPLEITPNSIYYIHSPLNKQLWEFAEKYSRHNGD